MITVYMKHNYPRTFRRKKGDYVLPFVVRPSGPSVCPSIRPSVRQQFTSISSYTIDARITKLICMIPLCIQMVATYLKLFYYFQFWNNSDFSDFTPKCNFSGNLSRNWFKFFKCMGGMSYTSYIKRVLSCDFQITSENGNIDGGGGFWKKIVYYFSLPASSPALLMLESPTYMHDTPMHTDGGDVFEIFLHLPVLK